MSSVVTTRGPQRFTYEDLDEMPDDGCKREVIGGSLIVTPSPTSGHQAAVGGLFFALRAAETADTKVMVAPLDWHQPDGGSVQPDVMVIRRQDYDPGTRLAASVIPLLVVEVLPPSNASYDRTLKRELYESLAVPAYWMLNPQGPQGPSILALRLGDDRYDIEAEMSTGTFATTWPFPVRVALDDLLR